MSKGLKTSVVAKQIRPAGYEIASRSCTTAPGLKETNLKASFLLKGPRSERKIDANYRFWTKQELPYLFADVSAFIPVTADETATQPVDRRYMSHIDYRLQELALAQLKPDFKKSHEKSNTINVWKMNYEGEMSSYTFDYDKYNPKNLNLDSVNNQITPGWVAVSNGQKGLLIAFQTTKRAGFGAVPMRLRDNKGDKDIFLNPFGTYFGKQFDYSHVGGEKLGTVLANLGGVFVRPNAPSYAGRSLHFELMIAPYFGDEPPKDLVRAALDFAYPAVGLMIAPWGIQDDFQSEKISFEALTRSHEQTLYGDTVTTPVGLGIAALDRAARVTWKSTNPAATDEFEVGYRKKGYFAKWTLLRTKDTSLVIPNLVNNRLYEVTVRAIKLGRTPASAVASSLAPAREVTPSADVKDSFVNEIAPTPKLIWMFLDGIVKYARAKDPDKR
ncbi:MAG: hypothetical protein EOP05_10730 [Proteobacteria bacterium]|nr:MAG: hypothetical protein EOP05_10730 [Pseudomonadota bacterium]